MTEPLTRCSIGWDLDGQTSGVLLFSGAAELKLVSSMLNRLARHVDNPCDESVGCAPYASDPDLWVDTATVSSQERLKRLLLGSKCRIFAALLPARTVNGRCLEPHNGHHALLRGDKTHVWITRTAQDVIRSMGGTPALLPLAHQLLSDFPGSPVNDSPVHFAGQNVDTVLSVLLSFLDDNVANQVRNLVICAQGPLVRHGRPIRIRYQCRKSVCKCSVNVRNSACPFLADLATTCTLPRVSLLPERLLLRGRCGDPGDPSSLFSPKELCFGRRSYCYGA